MSTIAVDNVKPAAGGTSFTTHGIAKAYCHYNQVTSTTHGSNNISSVTDSSAGKSIVNFTSYFADVYYSSSGQSTTNRRVQFNDTTITNAQGTSFLGCLVTNEVTTAIDCTVVTTICTGDLA